MVAIAVVTLFIAILAGMGISVFAFGTGGKRSKVFEDIYFSVEDVNGMGIVYTKGGFCCPQNQEPHQKVFCFQGQLL